MDNNSTSSSNSSEPIDFSKDVNDYLNYYIRIADAKAGAFLAGCLAIGTALAKSEYCSQLTGILGIVSTLFILASAVLGILVILPRLPRGHNGLIFWEDIRAWDSKEKYLAEIEDLDTEKKEKQYAKQNWHVSNILHKKHLFVRWCMFLFLGGFILYSLSKLL